MGETEGKEGAGQGPVLKRFFILCHHKEQLCLKFESGSGSSGTLSVNAGAVLSELPSKEGRPFPRVGQADESASHSAGTAGVQGPAREEELDFFDHETQEAEATWPTRRARPQVTPGLKGDPTCDENENTPGCRASGSSPQAQPISETSRSTSSSRRSSQKAPSPRKRASASKSDRSSPTSRSSTQRPERMQERRSATSQKAKTGSAKESSAKSPSGPTAGRSRTRTPSGRGA